MKQIDNGPEIDSGGTAETPAGTPAGPHRTTVVAPGTQGGGIEGVPDIGKRTQGLFPTLATPQRSIK